MLTFNRRIGMNCSIERLSFHERLNDYPLAFSQRAMSGARHANFNRALVLSLLMMMMTQVGYLESMNPWTNGEETLDETNDVLETGGSGSATQSNFTASIEGADLIIDEPMTNITFQYNASAASGSGNGSSSTSAFAYANNKMAAGNDHTCAILDNGDLKCWGLDDYGQLGDGGTNTDINAPSSTAIDLGTGRTAVAVSPGNHHNCAILDNGDLKC
jgi:hypothetical protein